MASYVGKSEVPASITSLLFLHNPKLLKSPDIAISKKKTVEIAQLWQHNRGNYTTPTIYQKRKIYHVFFQEQQPAGNAKLEALLLGCRHNKDWMCGTSLHLPFFDLKVSETIFFVYLLCDVQLKLFLLWKKKKQTSSIFNF